MPAFTRDDLTLHYRERGDAQGPPVVLMHGLLWSSRMMERITALLPEARVLLLDLHGHGRSAKPTDPARYTWDEMAADVVGLLDHLGIDQAVVGGLSLGANVALYTGQRHPDRVRGLVIEMPVLSRGHPFGRPVFNALATTYSVGRLAMTPLAGLVRRIPVPRQPDLIAMRDVAGADPRVATAVLRGLLSQDPIADDDAALARLTMPALVIGHRNDPLHVLEDAKDLAERLSNARFVEASSIVEFRLRPGRLARELKEFLARLPAAG